MIDSSDSKQKQEAQAELIRARAEMLCDAVSRRYTDSIGDLCVRILAGYDLDVIKEAFNKAELVFDRFTEFNKLREYCETIAGIRRGADRHVDEDCSLCRGTGWKLMRRSDDTGDMAISCECRKRKMA